MTFPATPEPGPAPAEDGARVALMAFAGAAAVSLALAALWVWWSPLAGMPTWAFPAAGAAFALVIVAWRRAMRRPWVVAGALVAAVAGSFCGAVLGVLLSALLDTRPEI